MLVSEKSLKGKEHPAFQRDLHRLLSLTIMLVIGANKLSGQSQVGNILSVQ